MHAALPAAVRGKGPRWVAQWKLSPADARKLYLSLAAALRVSGDGPGRRGSVVELLVWIGGMRVVQGMWVSNGALRA